MRITKRQLRQIIVEESAAVQEMFRLPPTQKDTPGFLAQEILFLTDEGENVTVEEGREDGELYIMTGGAQGITVKVLRRGR